MPKIKQTREQARAALIEHCKAFVDEHEDDQGLLSADDQAVVDAMLAGAESLQPGNGFRRQADLDRNPGAVQTNGRGARLIDANGRVHRALTASESVADAVRENAEMFGVSADQEKYCDDGLTIGGYMRALVTGPQTKAERWAVSESNPVAGGYMTPSLLAAMMIDRFRTRVVVMRAGAQTLPLTTDEHIFAKLTGDATAAWRRENKSIAESDPTFGAIKFHARSLAVLVKASRENLEDAAGIGQAIERSLEQSLGVEVDRAALLGAGPIEPVGLRHVAGLNEIASVGALTDYSDYVDAWKLLLDDNAPDPTAAIISNREWATLNKLEDSTGQPLRIPPAVENLPFLPTSAIPTNLGGGSNESLSFVGHFPDLILGMRTELQIEVLRELFAQNHQYAFVAHLRMDVGVFHEESFCRLLGITP